MAANAPIIRDFTAAADFAPLSAERCVGSFEISAPPGNTGNIVFLGDDGVSEVAWIPGEYHTFSRVDLSQMQAKGNPGDKLRITGGVW